MIDWKLQHPWTQAEYIERSDNPKMARERIANCDGSVESEWTPEEKYGSIGPGSREPRFTVVLSGGHWKRRFVFTPGLHGVRYRMSDLGAA